MFITVNRIGNSITGSVDGKPFGISYSEDKYNVLTAIADKANSASTKEELQQAFDDFKLASKESFKEVIETKTPYLYVNSATGKFYLKVGSGPDAIVSSKALPEAFVTRITKSVEMGLSVLPLVKAWSRFLRNPNYTDRKANYFANYINKTTINQALVNQFVQENGLSHELATERATTFQTPITQEGLLMTYKVSAELEHKYILDENNEAKRVPIKQAIIDPYSGLITYVDPKDVEDRIFYPAVQGLHGGDAFFSGSDLGHIIRVGQVHRLENWSQVNTTDGQCCLPGLHVGNIDYIRGYQNSGTVTHNVFVDPMNLGAFTDNGDGAIRVLEYFVYNSFAGVTRSIYHSSEYAKKTDEQYEQLFAEAAAKYKVDSETAAQVYFQRESEAKALRTI